MRCVRVGQRPSRCSAAHSDTHGNLPNHGRLDPYPPHVAHKHYCANGHADSNAHLNPDCSIIADGRANRACGSATYDYTAHRDACQTPSATRHDLRARW